MEAIGRALSAVDERDAKEWLAHHGYILRSSRLVSVSCQSRF
jgi:hypothetical protein